MEFDEMILFNTTEADSDASPVPGQGVPQFWELLNPSDQQEYLKLRQTLALQGAKTKRSKATDGLYEILKLVRSFVVRGEPDDSARGLVCGIVWLENGIAINTHQLRLTSGKCKSSINAGFQGMGYGTIPSGADVSAELVKHFPFMNNQFGLLRQWTVRQKVDESQPQKLTDIIQQKLSERNRSADEFITPPPPGDGLSGDIFVNSYLNDECSLGDMVRALIQNRRQPAQSPVPPQPPLMDNRSALDDDGLCFFQRDAPWVTSFGFDDF
jgi:hypothetical protein